MKACVLESVGNLEYKDVPMPQLEDDEVLLKITACGICSSDIDRVYKTGTYHFPTIPGHEFAGEIVDVGREVEKKYLGKRATVFPLKPCFRCTSCKEQQYARCENYDYYGSRCDGAFAEYLAVKKWNLFCYEGISDHEAAMCEPASVALHAVKGAVKEGDTVLIIGTGTIGYLAAMWSGILGAGSIIIVGRNEQKLEYAHLLGIDRLKTLKNDNAQKYFNDLKRLTNDSMPDVVIECVGSNDTLNTAIISARKGGTVVLVGNPEGQMVLNRDIYWKILRKELTVKGSWNSEVSEKENNWRVSLENMQNGNLKLKKLITHTFSLEEYKAAFDAVRDANEFTIKVILTNEGKDE